LTKGGAGKLVIDIRRTTSGSFDEGLALARLFVGKGTLAVRETKGGPRETITAGSNDGSIAAPAVLLSTRDVRRG
jgi:C-terminal processing protease CtpA/Prc